MHPPGLRLSILGALAGLCLLAGCEPSGAISADATEPQRAPDIAWTHDGDDLTLASLRGRTVVLHFAGAASPTWSALEEAFPDLDAEGATVVGIVTDDGARPPSAFATTHGDGLATLYDVGDDPTAIVVDAEGWVRGRQLIADADAFFALAGPVLLEGESAGTTVSVPEPGAARLDAESLASLARAGAALIDVRPDDAREADGWVPLALPCPLPDLSPRELPADLASTLVFLGPEAGTAADLAVGWGYSSVIVLTDAAPYLDAAAEPVERLPQPLAPMSQPRTVRG